MVNRRDFLSLMSAGAVALLTRNLLAAEAAGSRRPNIIIILADDLGYADLGCQSAPDVRTPNIDTLAKNGVRFTDGYVSAPMCSPTRAGLMTGRYQQRFGHEVNPGQQDRGPNTGLPLTERTLADVLKDNGYATGIVGKWHLGLDPKFHPLKRGFQEFFGFLNSSHPYYSHNSHEHDLLYRGSTPVEEKAYLTDAFTREAVSFIERHQRQPFFLYLPFNAVHVPLDPPPQKYLDRFPNIQQEKRRLFCAMLSAMDDSVGAVLDKLWQLNLENDTLIFFFSDNGGPTAGNSSRNTPFRGGKGGVHEGGIRIPFLFQWKNHVPAGKVYSQPIIALDIFPTALAAAGIAPAKDRPLDGVNLLPFVKGESNGHAHETLYWRHGDTWAIRQGNWKLRKDPDGSVYLFNLAADPGERRDQKARQPQLVKQLSEAFAQWNAQLAKPLWNPPPPAQNT